MSPNLRVILNYPIRLIIMRNKLIFIILLGLLSSCIVPPESKKKDCPDAQLSLIVSSDSSDSSGSSDQPEVTNNSCADITLYKCDARVFSPDVQSSRSLEDFCFSEDNSLCIFVDTMRFSTNNQKTTDKYATEQDFESGGQYNYKEVSCYHRDLMKEGKYQATGEGSSVEMALEKAISSCKGIK